MAIARYRLYLAGQAPFSLPIFGNQRKWKLRLEANIEAEIYDIDAHQKYMYSIDKVHYILQEEQADGMIVYDYDKDGADLYYTLLRHFSTVDNEDWYMVDIANSIEGILQKTKELVFPERMEKKAFQIELCSSFVGSKRSRSGV